MSFRALRTRVRQPSFSPSSIRPCLRISCHYPKVWQRFSQASIGLDDLISAGPDQQALVHSLTLLAKFDELLRTLPEHNLNLRGNGAQQVLAPPMPGSERVDG